MMVVVVGLFLYVSRVSCCWSTGLPVVVGAEKKRKKGGATKPVCTVGVGPRVGHGEEAAPRVGVVEGLVGELGAVDRLSCVCVWKLMRAGGRGSVCVWAWSFVCSSLGHDPCTMEKAYSMSVGFTFNTTHTAAAVIICTRTSPPVPSWLVKSPPCAMKPLMTRWNVDPLKCSGSPVSALAPLFIHMFASRFGQSQSSHDDASIAKRVKGPALI